MHVIVVLEDRISEWVAKGELLEGYFNPGGVFDKITVVALLSDEVDAKTVSNLCKPASSVYLNANLSRKRLSVAAGKPLRIRMIKALGTLVDELELGPANLVRGYGEGLAAVVSEVIGSRLSVPFVISLHQTADPKILKKYSSLKDQIWRRLIKMPVEQALRASDGLIAVYSPIIDYLPRSLATRAEVIPNVVGVRIRPSIKANNRDHINIICVGRQIPGRDPRPIVRAVANEPHLNLTLVGGGPLHADVRKEVMKWDLGDRVQLVESMPNSSLCNVFRKFDVMAINSGFREVSKSLMEAALSGVPIIVNEGPASTIRELSAFPLVYAQGDPTSYREVLEEFAKNPNKRYELARSTAEVAWSVWNPQEVGLRAGKYLAKIVERKSRL
tara:strand:- start:2572 stop:3732 length:1161 start_codon:yes stop_codon:yes gene_type:complete